MPKRKPVQPLTVKQQLLIEEWYPYAMKVAYNRARKPYDEHELRSVVHDALMSAARHYKPNRGFTSFKSFYVHCFVQRLGRTYRKRIKLIQVPDEIIVATNPDESDFETRELVDYLKLALPPNYSEIIHEHYYEGQSARQIAAAWNCKPQNINACHKRALALMRSKAVRSYCAAYTGPGSVPAVPVADTHNVADRRRLPPAVRTAILRLVATTSLSYSEIAGQTGVTKGTVGRIAGYIRVHQRREQHTTILHLAGTMQSEDIARHLGIAEAIVVDIIYRDKYIKQIAV